MFAYNNVQFIVSDENDFTVATLNRMVSETPYNKFFSRSIQKGRTILVRAPGSFSAWLKTKGNYEKLASYGNGASNAKVDNTKFNGLYWREDKKRLYVMYDERTIPWKNWVEWLEKKTAVMS